MTDVLIIMAAVTGMVLDIGFVAWLTNVHWRREEEE